ncbi:DUF397 domain-containing protein [Streptomyces sp. NPDC048483]|uniref:DUF397 domain-containing protein n=1 Tax=Streptomyces sp. NPDC048483 TaxID=3154927 RepID=UPI00342DB28F
MGEERWQKSSYSGGDDAPNCLEVAYAQAGVSLRESDTPDDTITASQGPLQAFIRAVRAGRIDEGTA